LLQQKIYFPALDCLRAIAMLMVFVTHFESVMDILGLSGYTVHYLTRFSSIGLSLFFVLSGFLITYLLLAEQRAFRTIHVPDFYIRRMLRIWPLYYLIVLIGQFLIPYTGLLGWEQVDRSILGPNFWKTAACYLLFMPNIAFLMVRPVNPYIGMTWSIGAEEQFYLVWPWILKKCGRYLHTVLWMLILLTVLAFCLNWGLMQMKSHNALLLVLSKINAFLYWSRIGYFALGGLMAFYLLHRPGIVRRLTGQPIFWGCLFLLCASTVQIGFLLKEFLIAILLSILVLHAVQPGTLLSRLKSPVLLYLGKISYGMYLFHVITISIACKLLVNMGGLHLSAPVFCLLAYPLGLSLTVFAGALSFRYFESFFLRLKKRFQFVRSE
jgi:peptidoglycan/LPS O-acetylase OafA/YrhL